MAELAEDDGLRQIRHAGGGITGVVAAAAGDGGFGVAAAGEIGVVVGGGGSDGGGGGGGGGGIVVVVLGGNDENGGLGKARGHEISQCHPNRKPSSVIVHGIGKGFEAEGTLGFRRMWDVKMVMMAVALMMMMMMVTMMMTVMLMMKMKGAHRTVAAGTVSPRSETETSDTKLRFCEPKPKK